MSNKLWSEKEGKEATPLCELTGVGRDVPKCGDCVGTPCAALLAARYGFSMDDAEVVRRGAYEALGWTELMDGEARNEFSAPIKGELFCVPNCGEWVTWDTSVVPGELVVMLCCWRGFDEYAPCCTVVYEGLWF